MQHVKIPQDRIGVLIGEGGDTLREIEQRTDVRLNVDSENGSVSINAVGDSVKSLKGIEIVRAIGRGFAPSDAFRLLEGELTMLDIIDIDAHSRNKNDLQRQKGRLIGEGGRTRELMEELTGAAVVIYGSTLAAIGSPEQVETVRTATEMLLDGAPHGTVYSYLEEQQRERHQGGLSYHPYSK